MNYIEDIGLDWYEHSFNAGLHLNVFGAELMSQYFGGILRNEFYLPDRRTEPAAKSHWHTMAEQYHRLIAVQQEEIKQTGRVSSFLIN